MKLVRVGELPGEGGGIGENPGGVVCKQELPIAAHRDALALASCTLKCTWRQRSPSKADHLGRDIHVLQAALTSSHVAKLARSQAPNWAGARCALALLGIGVYWRSRENITEHDIEAPFPLRPSRINVGVLSAVAPMNP